MSGGDDDLLTAFTSGQLGTGGELRVPGTYNSTFSIISRATCAEEVKGRSRVHSHHAYVLSLRAPSKPKYEVCASAARHAYSAPRLAPWLRAADQFSPGVWARTVFFLWQRLFLQWLNLVQRLVQHGRRSCNSVRLKSLSCFVERVHLMCFWQSVLKQARFTMCESRPVAGILLDAHARRNPFGVGRRPFSALQRGRRIRCSLNDGSHGLLACLPIPPPLLRLHLSLQPPNETCMKR